MSLMSAESAATIEKSEGVANANGVIDSNASLNEQGLSQEPVWQYADGVPGVGDKPEFLSPKFKSVAEQAKSYVELEKKFGGFKGAPDEYKLDLPQEITSKVNINIEDPLYKSFADVAKKSNMSQEAFNEFVGMYAQNTAEEFAKNSVNVENELKKLGDNAGARIDTITKWASNNFDADDFQLIKRFANNAEAIKVLEKIKSKMTSGQIPTNANTADNRSYEDKEKAVQSMMMGENYDKYVSDPAYRAQVTAEFNKLYNP